MYCVRLVDTLSGPREQKSDVVGKNGPKLVERVLDKTVYGIDGCHKSAKDNISGIRPGRFSP